MWGSGNSVKYRLTARTVLVFPTPAGLHDANPIALLRGTERGNAATAALVARERATGEALEPHFEPSLGLVQDTAREISGPLWVRGGIPVIGADGVTYEVRNRVALCRCGGSGNKPFCDGTHLTIDFDGTLAN